MRALRHANATEAHRPHDLKFDFEIVGRPMANPGMLALKRVGDFITVSVKLRDQRACVHLGLTVEERG